MVSRQRLAWTLAFRDSKLLIEVDVESITNVALYTWRAGFIQKSLSNTKLSTCVQNILLTDVVSYITCIRMTFSDSYIRMIMLLLPITSFDILFISEMNRSPVNWRIIGSKIAKFSLQTIYKCDVKYVTFEFQVF